MSRADVGSPEASIYRHRSYSIYRHQYGSGGRGPVVASQRLISGQGSTTPGAAVVTSSFPRSVSRPHEGNDRRIAYVSNCSPGPPQYVDYSNASPNRYRPCQAASNVRVADFSYCWPNAPGASCTRSNMQSHAAQNHVLSHTQSHAQSNARVNAAKIRPSFLESYYNRSGSVTSYNPNSVPGGVASAQQSNVQYPMHFPVFPVSNLPSRSAPQINSVPGVSVNSPSPGSYQFPVIGSPGMQPRHSPLITPITRAAARPADRIKSETGFFSFASFDGKPSSFSPSGTLSTTATSAHASASGTRGIKSTEYTKLPQSQETTCSPGHDAGAVKSRYSSGPLVPLSTHMGQSEPVRSISESLDTGNPTTDVLQTFPHGRRYNYRPLQNSEGLRSCGGKSPRVYAVERNKSSGLPSIGQPAAQRDPSYFPKPIKVKSEHNASSEKRGFFRRGSVDSHRADSSSDDESPDIPCRTHGHIAFNHRSYGTKNEMHNWEHMSIAPAVEQGSSQMLRERSRGRRRKKRLACPTCSKSAERLQGSVDGSKIQGYAAKLEKQVHLLQLQVDTLREQLQRAAETNQRLRRQRQINEAALDELFGVITELLRRPKKEGKAQKPSSGFTPDFLAHLKSLAGDKRSLIAFILSGFAAFNTSTPSPRSETSSRSVSSPRDTLVETQPSLHAREAALGPQEKSQASSFERPSSTTLSKQGRQPSLCSSQINVSEVASSCRRLFDRLSEVKGPEVVDPGNTSSFGSSWRDSLRLTSDEEEKQRAALNEALVDLNAEDGSLTEHLELSDNCMGSYQAKAADDLPSPPAVPTPQRTQQTRPATVPPLGLRGVGAGKWLSGHQTSGDTYAHYP